MKVLLRSSFTRQFVGGFLIGAVGLFTLTPAHSMPVSSAAVETVR